MLEWRFKLKLSIMATYAYSPITVSEYTTLIKDAQLSTFYNSSLRLTFIKKRNRKTALFKVEAEGSVVALVVYQVIPARSGSFVYFQHSPVFINLAHAEKLEFWTELKDFAYSVGQKEQAVYVRLTPRILNSKQAVTDILAAGYKRAPVQELDACVTRVIKLSTFADTSLRSDLADLQLKAQKRGLTVTFSKMPEAVEDFVAMYRTLSAKHQIDFVPVDYLRDELKIYADQGELLVAIVKDEKDTMYGAAAIILQQDSAWYYWAATTEQGKELGAEVLLLTQSIAALKQLEISELDLWGGSVSRDITEKGLPHPWKQQDLFKQGFGATLVEYLPALDIPIKTPQYLAAVFYQRALMTKRGYPYIPLKA